MGGYLEPTKDDLRRRLLAVRRALPEPTAAHLSEAICAHAMALAAVQTARHVVGYLPRGGEVDPRGVLAACDEAGKRVYLAPPTPEHAEVLPAAPGGIAPDPLAQGVEPPCRDDTVFLIPGVAFDLRGVRLGRGRGWYDRTLSSCSGAVRVGLAYELQVVASVPEEAWDMRMHALATEARLLWLAELAPQETRE